MKHIYICHYSEIGLKKGNRGYFERLLKKNIRTALQRLQSDAAVHLQTINKRILLKMESGLSQEQIAEALASVFGLANYAPALELPRNIEAVAEAALGLLAKRQYASFAVRSKRSDKTFSMTSQEINEQVGAAIVGKYAKKVDLSHPELTVHIEVLRDHIYVYAGKIQGPGGLPVGSAGNVLTLLSGGFDSPVAAYMALKRGVHSDFIHFHSFPFTQKTSQEKVQNLAKVLNRFQFSARLYNVPFAETQKEIVLNCPEKLRVILYRRFMMRIAERLAQHNGYKAVITGEAIGQVASQTLENLAAVQDAIDLTVLRPLIAFDKNEIIAIARNIDTYEISALPHDDACTRFMPKHPEIHARIDEVRRAEEKLDIAVLVERDLKETEVIKI